MNKRAESLAGDKAFELIPERQLTNSLPPVWHKRFDKALHHILENLQQPLNWPEVAKLCAISPNHFREMFRLVFNETPGQYLRRMRLKLAVYYLCTEKEMSITHIAAETGFSSSQALAKALKQTLNTSASEIRERVYQHDEQLIEKLSLFSGHPLHERDGSMEQDLASKMPVKLEDYPERYVYKHNAAVSSFSWLEKTWRRIKPQTAGDKVIVYRWQDISAPQPEDTYDVGFLCEREHSNQKLPAGLYLACRVNVDSLAGYYATLNSFYNRALQQGFELNPSVPVIEVYHQWNECLSTSLDMSLSVLVKPL